MKCPNCKGLGYPVETRPVMLGEPFDPLPICEPCKGTGVIPDPKPVSFKSKLSEARKMRRG
jgi:DnaJ-class molecular chaperone